MYQNRPEIPWNCIDYTPRDHIILNVKATSFKIVYLFLLFIFYFSSALILNVFADVAFEERNQLINNELNCVNSHLKYETSLTWHDVCFTSEADFNHSQRAEVITETLDKYEKTLNNVSST